MTFPYSPPAPATERFLLEPLGISRIVKDFKRFENTRISIRANVNYDRQDPRFTVEVPVAQCGTFLLFNFSPVKLLVKSRDAETGDVSASYSLDYTVMAERSEEDLDCDYMGYDPRREPPEPVIYDSKVMEDCAKNAMEYLLERLSSEADRALVTAKLDPGDLAGLLTASISPILESFRHRPNRRPSRVEPSEIIPAKEQPPMQKQWKPQEGLF